MHNILEVEHAQQSYLKIQLKVVSCAVYTTSRSQHVHVVAVHLQYFQATQLQTLTAPSGPQLFKQVSIMCYMPQVPSMKL